MKSVEVVDLFCGVGGLTHGLQQAGLKVVAGVDIDPKCQYPFEVNNDAKFHLKSVGDLKHSEVSEWFSAADITVLAGCAPCQPFSRYSQGPRGKQDDKWKLLYDFQRLIVETGPTIVTMENVPKLIKFDVFSDFVASLERHKYHVSYQLVECEKYGLPQTRKRLVLLASKLGEIELINPTHTKPEQYLTVKNVIHGLPRLRAGKTSTKDLLHKSSSLSALNLERIKASKPGGTWRDWPENLVAECHKKTTGHNYVSVYGRMEWDKPSPTVTTQFFGFGNGRFGHPTQNRAISLREGAILQSFPANYQFTAPGEQLDIKTTGRLIGNAVPVRLGEVIGESITKHIKSYVGSDC